MKPRSSACAFVVAAAALVATSVLAACTSTPRATATATGTLVRPLHAPANFDPSLAGAVACSSLIVAGTVVDVVDAGPGRMRTTLRVTDWVKPASGPQTTTVDTVDIAAEGQYQRWVPGRRLYLAVDVDPTVLPNWDLAAAQFAQYRAAVPDASSLVCPYGPS